MKISCPICKTQREVPDDYGPRPFCSWRCKQVDLGNWLTEKYVIVEPLEAEDSEDDRGPLN